MNSSNEFNQIDENSIVINYEKIYKNKIEDDLYDVKEMMDDKHEKKLNISTDSYQTFKPLMNNDRLDQIHQTILHVSQCNLITDNGDIIHCLKNNSEDFQKSKLIIRQSIDSFSKYEDDGIVEPNTTPENSLTINEHRNYVTNNNEEEEEQKIAMKFHNDHHLKTKYNFITEHPLTHVDSQHSILIERISNEENDNDQFHLIHLEKINEEQNEKSDLKNLNAYESCLSSLLIHNKSQENEFNIIPITEYSYKNNQNSINYLLMCHISLVNIEYCTTSKYFIIPQLIENHIESFDCFQQYWSPQLYLTKLINSNRSENILSNHWSLLILYSKFIITRLHLFYSYIKIFRYDILLFSFYYLLGTLFGMNAYLFIDFLLLITCIISICMSTYKKWVFFYIYSNKYDNNDNELTYVENKNQYWKLLKLIAYGFTIGTISTYFM
ncbi:unnamed protein product [Rotaria sp. Silwood1]|nr:unnamed protein product [Rotaria sp. Silwood1]